MICAYFSYDLVLKNKSDAAVGIGFLAVLEMLGEFIVVCSLLGVFK